MSKALSLVGCLLLGSSLCGAQEVPRMRHHPGDVVGPPLVIDQGAATTVQLPTFSFFSISTTVMVPDSGGALLGGVSGAGSGTRSSGFGSRSTASSFNGGSMSVGVQIHDMRAMDRALLGDKREPDAQAIAEQRWIARVERAKESTAGRPAVSVAEARRRALAAR